MGLIVALRLDSVYNGPVLSNRKLPHLWLYIYIFLNLKALPPLALSCYVIRAQFVVRV